MGLISNLLGNATEIDIAKVQAGISSLVSRQPALHGRDNGRTALR